MHVPAEVKAKITEITAACLAKAEAHFGRKYAMPRIEYTVRGRKGGYAQGGFLMNFNPVLLMENLEDYYTNTVPHETAHIIDSLNGDNVRKDFAVVRLRNGRVRRAKREIHGPSWKHIMRVLGVKDITRCHDYDVTNAAVTTRAKFEYKCGCCNKSYFLSSVRHNKIRRGIKQYWCRVGGRARGSLTFIDPNPVTGVIKFDFSRLPFPLRQVVTPAQPEARTYQVLKPRPVPQGNVAIAKSIWAQYGGDLTRGQFITRAVAEGMKETTASTYYAGLKARRL